MFIQVLGVGSFWGEDKAGWLVIEALRKKSALRPLQPERLGLKICDRPQLQLVTELAAADKAIVVDAMHSGNPLGTIQQFAPATLKAGQGLISSHGIGVVEAIQLAAILGKLPAIELYGIEISHWNTEATISDAVLNAVQRLADQITQAILAYYSD